MYCEHCRYKINTEVKVLNILGERLFFCSEDCFYCYVEERVTEEVLEEE